MNTHAKPSGRGRREPGHVPVVRPAVAAAGVDPGRDKLLEFRREVLALYLRITACAAVVIVPTYYLVGINALTLASLGFFAAVIALYVAFRRGLVEVVTAAHLFLAASVAICMLGLYLGNESFDNKPWQILLVIAAFSLVDAREGLAWSAACMVGIVVIAMVRAGAYEPLSIMVLLSAQVTAVAALYFFARQHERNLRTIAHISHTDSLTQAYNRQLFDDLARNAFNRARRSEEPLALFMIDIDFFKRFNDHYGHVAGDRALAAVAGVIRHCARRATDLVFRYGGEEFCVISGGLDMDGARRLADSIIEGVRELGLEHTTADCGYLTVSIGMAHYEFLGECDVGGVLQQADAALYRAKQRGRNRLEHEDDLDVAVADYLQGAGG